MCDKELQKLQSYKGRSKTNKQDGEDYYGRTVKIIRNGFCYKFDSGTLVGEQEVKRVIKRYVKLVQIGTKS